MLLELENVTLLYGRIQALHGISLTVGEGEIVALIGANGAGKTTTMRAISGLRPVATGLDQVRRQGHHPAARRPAGGPGRLRSRPRAAASSRA